MDKFWGKYTESWSWIPQCTPDKGWRYFINSTQQNYTQLCFNYNLPSKSVISHSINFNTIKKMLRLLSMTEERPLSSKFSPDIKMRIGKKMIVMNMKLIWIWCIILLCSNILISSFFEVQMSASILSSRWHCLKWEWIQSMKIMMIIGSNIISKKRAR